MKYGAKIYELNAEISLAQIEQHRYYHAHLWEAGPCAHCSELLRQAMIQYDHHIAELTGEKLLLEAQEIIEA